MFPVRMRKGNETIEPSTPSSNLYGRSRYIPFRKVYFAPAYSCCQYTSLALTRVGQQAKSQPFARHNMKSRLCHELAPAPYKRPPDIKGCSLCVFSEHPQFITSLTHIANKVSVAS